MSGHSASPPRPTRKHHSKQPQLSRPTPTTGSTTNTTNTTSTNTNTIITVNDIIGTIAIVPFGGQRLPELQTLAANVVVAADDCHDSSVITTTTTTITTIPWQSSGRKKSHVRHLRRRTTSYKRYHHQYQQHHRTTGTTTTHSCRSSSSSNKGSTTTLSSCNNSSSGNNDNNDSVIPNNNDDNNSNSNNEPPPPPPPSVLSQTCRRRRTRRQNQHQLCQPHDTWWWKKWYSHHQQQQPQQQQPQYQNDHSNQNSTPLVSSLFWMTTHLYHRKRCHMVSLWNWALPLYHTNRGGTAALRLVTTTTKKEDTNSTILKKNRSKCLIQDATWSMQPIWFRICYNSNNNDQSANLSLHRSFQSILQSRMIPDFHLVASIATAKRRNDEDHHCHSILCSDDRGILHEPFCFPNKALGPITWIYRSHQPLFHHHSNTAHCNHDDDNNKNHKRHQRNDYIYFMVHPSIHSTVLAYFVELMSHQQSDTPDDDTGIHGPYAIGHPAMDDHHDNSGGALSCFQLRGSNEACGDCLLESWTTTTTLGRRDTNIINHNDEKQHTKTTIPKRHHSNETDTRPSSVIAQLDHFLNPSSCHVIQHNDIRAFHLPLTLLAPRRSVAQHHGVRPVGSEPDESSSMSTSFTVYLRRVRPRDASLSYNWGVCGYDIFCPPRYSKLLFQNFVLYGGACLIGVVEEVYVALECCPPLLVFPRDYPDTDEGRKYWNGSCDEWRLLRHYWEGGGGRISKFKPELLVNEEDTGSEALADTYHRNDNKSCRTIAWEKVLGHNDDHDMERDVVVVRSEEFIRPFRLALSGGTSVTIQAESDREETCESHINGTTRKRKRRPMNGRHGIVEACRISVAQQRHHRVVCQSFLDNLSLPAVLMCSIEVHGKGTLQPGCGIYTTPQCNDSNTTPNGHVLLGWVTAGSFSMARGYCCGIAMIGANAFLTALIQALAVNDGDSPPRSHSSIVIRSCTLSKTKTKSVQLKVSVENRHRPLIGYEGILSLL